MQPYITTKFRPIKQLQKPYKVGIPTFDRFSISFNIIVQFKIIVHFRKPLQHQ